MAKAFEHDHRPAGLLLHNAAFYDFGVWLMTFGRERALREKMVGLARLKPGESVLDVGCGTGGVAIAAKRQVGDTGVVEGIDASAEMVARAGTKAERAGTTIAFKQAAAQALPFPDAQFDVVLTTVMLHHLPRKGREQCLQEARRVLKPGGRVLAIDFAGERRPRRGILRHLHRHGQVAFEDIIAIMKDTGLHIVECGGVGFRDLRFALALAPER